MTHGPFQRIIWTDPVTGAQGFVVIDRLVGAIATGGTRMRPGCTIDEVAALAAEMSLKTGAFNLPVGGAKGGIDCDPASPEARGVMHRFVQAMRPLLERTWVTAGDLGTPQPVLDEIFAEAGIGSTSLHAAMMRSPDPARARARVKKAFAEQVEGQAMPDLIGGFGVAEAALAGLERLGADPAETTAVVQGFGAMGGSSARYLAAAGVRVTGVADAGGLLVNERGLDVELLLRSRSRYGAIDRSALGDDVTELPREAWLALDADVLVPAATSYVITGENCDSVNARLVVEAANVPTTAEAEALLVARGIGVIPDFIANTGAAAWAWWVILDQVAGPDDAFARLASEMRPLVAGMMDGWSAGGSSPRAVAQEIAEARLDQLAVEYGDVVERESLFGQRAVASP